MSAGYVYILTNEAMPDLVKIGRTGREVDIRAAELWQTGVPSPFNIYWTFKTPDCAELEAMAHRSLRKYRLCKQREFFHVDPERAVESIRYWADVQADEWVMSHFSGHAAITLRDSIARDGIDRLAEEARQEPRIIAEALADVSADELRPAIARVLAQRQREEAELRLRLGLSEDEWGA